MDDWLEGTGPHTKPNTHIQTPLHNINMAYYQQTKVRRPLTLCVIESPVHPQRLVHTVFIFFFFSRSRSSDWMMMGFIVMALWCIKHSSTRWQLISMFNHLAWRYLSRSFTHYFAHTSLVGTAIYFYPLTTLYNHYLYIPIFRAIFSSLFKLGCYVCTKGNRGCCDRHIQRTQDDVGNRIRTVVEL